jgi:uncharacterized delta-60 repeat protein
MNRKPIAEFISHAVKAAAPVAAVATSLAAPLAQAASGDLDPAFGDHGRLGAIPGGDGAAWSVESLDDGKLFVGGGDYDFNWQCWYDWDCELSASGFAASLEADGGVDPGSAGWRAEQFEALAVARQPDGKVVMAGFGGTARHRNQSLVVIRLASDGSVDTGFGEEGEFVLPAEQAGAIQKARALLLEPDGHIVVAGNRYDGADGALIVLRLTADGQLDPAFAAGGIYERAGAEYGNVRIVRTVAGAYRVAYGSLDGCAIAGLTSAGGPDASFGTAGISAVSAGGERANCDALAQRDDGSLLVAGNTDGKGFAARFSASGEPDAAFAADPAVSADWVDATSIAATQDGKVLVAGAGLRGASIMRLLATGALDAAFGDGGRTWIDLASESVASPVVYSLSPDAGGDVLAAGGDYFSDKPFVVRLQGDGGGASAGILSAVEGFATATEAEGHAVLHVRRSGGSAGSVSVEYRTRSDGEAVAGEDFTPVSGTLHWADGDATEREIEIPITRDDGNPEVYEYFGVVLQDASGGAGLGGTSASIEIQPDGAPAGQISIYDATSVVIEGGTAVIAVSRDYYSEGEVSVTITPDSGTATAGDDFADASYTVTWAAGNADVQYIRIPIVDDSTHEGNETFTVRLSNPTGGAILGAHADQAVTIAADSSTSPGGRDGGGGGTTGWLSIFLLGCLQFFRGARRRT